MIYYPQYRIHDLFELQESLSGLSKSNRWVKLADRLPWAKIEKEYNKRLRNSHCGAGNKPVRMVVGALIVKHVENLSDEDGNDHGGTMKCDATCCDAEVRYPTDSNLLEDGSRLVDRLLDKFCARHKVRKPQTHCMESRCAFILLIKKKRKGRKLVSKTKLTQIRCFQTDFQIFLDLLGKQAGHLLSCFSRHDYKCLEAAFKIYEQQKMMLEQNVRSCADRIISIYQPHLRPIVRGKAKARVEFGAKIGASIVNGYTYVDHLSWDAYNESSDLAMQIELYRKRFGMLPREVQVDKIYLGKANRQYLKDNSVECYNRPQGRPPKEDNDRHAEEKRRSICERNEIEATFGTSKRVYRTDDIRAKLDNTDDTWIGACFFAKNAMKFLRGLLCLVFAKTGLEALKKRILSAIDDFVGVLLSPQVSWGRIN